MIFGGLDFETTGLDPQKGHRIIEVALDLRKEDGSRLGTYETRINPERSIDPAAEAVHGISYDMLLECPTWNVVAPKLSALVARCDYIIAHNGDGFDLPFMIHEFMRVGVAVPRIRSIDTMLQGRWATPDGAVPSLKALAWACDVEYDPSKAHGALYDVGVMLDCFFQQYPRGYFQLPTREFQMPKKEAA